MPSTTLNSLLPSATPSSNPVTVIVWGRFQFPESNVIVPAAPIGGTVIVPSAGSLTEIGIVTVSVGCELSTTSKELDVPLSDTSIIKPALTVTPAPDISSTLIKLTSGGLIMPS